MRPFDDARLGEIIKAAQTFLATSRPPAARASVKRLLILAQAQARKQLGS